MLACILNPLGRKKLSIRLCSKCINYKIAIKNHSWSNRVDMILSSLDSCDF